MSFRGWSPLLGLMAAVLVLALGTGSAWAAPSGLVRPLGGSAAANHTSAGAVGALGTSSIGLGSPSPYCDPVSNSCVPPLLYNGAPVMHAVTTHVIAWGAPSAFPTGYVSGYETFLNDLAHDRGLAGNVTSVATQYVDATGPALSSLTNDAPISDTDAYPSSGGCSVIGASVCLTEEELMSEVSHVIASQGLGVDIDQSYIVLLPPGVDSCFDSSSSVCEAQAFCGYHDAFAVGSSETTFTLLPYTKSSYSNSGGGECYDSSVTYPGNNPSTTALLALDSIGAHELMESATDPVVDYGYLDANGWEIGDECSWWYGTTASATGGGVFNQLVNGHQYLIQEMWSNQDNDCVQGDASTPTATIATGASQTTSPTSFSTTLTGASASGATYEWSYEDPYGNVSTNVSPSATPQLNLTTGGPNIVWVDVTDSAGATITGVKSVDVLGSPPAASFGEATSTTVPASGSAVSFTSTSSADPTEQITSSSWDFGDGDTGSGPTVSHIYAAAGVYTATLTVTETDGQTAVTSRAVTVHNPPSPAFTSSPDGAPAGAIVTFSSNGTSAGSGSISRYSWNFGDGSTSTAANPAHTYASAGSYVVTLTVAQTDGLTASVQHGLTVAAAATQASGGSSGGGSGGTGGSSGISNSASAAATSELAQAIIPSRSATRITTMLKAGGATIVVPAPTAAGHISVTWYAIYKHQKVEVAVGSANVVPGVAARVAVRLTRGGRLALRRSKRLRVTVVGVYVFGPSTVTVTKTLTLKR